MKGHRLRVKLIALMALAFLPLVWVVFYQAHKQRLMDEEKLHESLLRVARMVKANRSEGLRGVRTMLMTLAQTEGVLNPGKGDCHSLLVRLQESNPAYSNVGAFDLGGRIYCSAVKGLEGGVFPDKTALKRASESRDMGISDIYSGAGGRTVFYVYPVWDEHGELSGGVYASTDLLQISWFRRAEFALPREATLSVIDSHGLYLIHSANPQKYIGQPAGKEALIKAIPKGEEEGSFVVKRDGQRYFVVIERLWPLYDASVLYAYVEINSAVLDAGVAGRLKEELGLLGVVATVAVGATYLLSSRWIIRPTRHLVAVAREISQGNLVARTQMNGKGSEFAEIGGAMDQMADRLSRRIVDLDQTRRELQKIRGELEERVMERTAELEHSQAQLVDAVESIDAGFAMFDPNGVLRACNEQYREAFGREVAPMVQVGRSYSDLLDFFIQEGGTIDGASPSQEWLESRKRYFLLGEGGPVEERLPDRWIRLSIHRTHDGGRVVLLTDISSLKEAQEGLLLRNRAIAALNSGVLVTDPQQPDNPIVDCNPAFERVTGYSREEAIGRNCRFLQGQQSNPETVALLREAIEARREIQVVIRNYRKNGEPFWNELKISPVRDERGVLIHFVGVITDVTEREEADAVLKHAADELRRSNAELEQFAYVASHDLQEPLRMVASYTQLLARRYKDKLDADAQDFIEHAVNGARRMQAFIEDLLKYSRVGTMKRPFEEVDLNGLMYDLLENFSLTMAEIGGEVKVGPLPVIYGDKLQLGQLFQNLVGNAVKFRSDVRPLRVKIEAKPLDGEWEFSVRDNGIGFEAKDAGRIFEIFQRLKNEKKSKGTGMGLVICKKIVERHGGRIWAESVEGEGSTFYFTIDPARAKPEAILGSLM